MNNGGHCIACRAQEWIALPAIEGRSVLSDGRPLTKDLSRLTCGKCGLARHALSPDPDYLAEIFSRNYTLYAHAPGNAFERDRQNTYADWLSALVRLDKARTLFEVGCGNG